MCIWQDRVSHYRYRQSKRVLLKSNNRNHNTVNIVDMTLFRKRNLRFSSDSQKKNRSEVFIAIKHQANMQIVF